jgi:hypothetical protein
VDLFDEIEADVIFCLQTECIPKFVNSEWYKRFLDVNVAPPNLPQARNILADSRPMDVSYAIRLQVEQFDKVAELEREYQEKIRFLVHWFKSELENDVIKEDDSLILFANLEQIYLLHQYISKELVPDIHVSLTYQKAIFERHFLDIYRKYITNIPFAQLLSETLANDRGFKGKINSLERALAAKFKGCTFERLLFGVPLEFLQSLHKILSSSSSELSHSSSDSSAHTTLLLAELLNLSKNVQPSNSQKKLFQLRESLLGYPGNLAKPDRSFIMEGPMELVENGNARKYHWFLFNDKLVSATPLPNQMFQFVNFYPLLNAVVDSGPLLLITIMNAGPFDLSLKVGSQPEKAAWIKGIQEVVTEWKEMKRNQMLDKEKRFKTIADEMKKNIKLSDYGGLFKSFKNAFSGTDCVFYCIQKVPGCNSREEAEALGNQLLNGMEQKGQERRRRSGFD